MANHNNNNNIYDDDDENDNNDDDVVDGGNVTVVICFCRLLICDHDRCRRYTFFFSFCSTSTTTITTNDVDDDGQLIVCYVLAYKFVSIIITMRKYYTYDAMMFGHIGLNGSGRAFALKNNNNKSAPS